MNRKPVATLVDLTPLEAVPGLLCLLTSTYEDKRAGVLVTRVQRCGSAPALLSVACPKVESLEPLIRESRAFALNIIAEQDRYIAKLFEEHLPPDDENDRFAALQVIRLETGSPVLKRCVSFDCEVVRHVDVESEDELFVGRVVATHTP